mmetsp:Transcript_7669/g.23920  ORF Transcript_7669/g.23920 Transcript_7669/m.23920 type:complete len:202 (+) Transcript_7669:427-1032(+)
MHRLDHSPAAPSSHRTALFVPHRSQGYHSCFARCTCRSTVCRRGTAPHDAGWGRPEAECPDSVPARRTLKLEVSNSPRHRQSSSSDRIASRRLRFPRALKLFRKGNVSPLLPSKWHAVAAPTYEQRHVHGIAPRKCPRVSNLQRARACRASLQRTRRRLESKGLRRQMDPCSSTFQRRLSDPRWPGGHEIRQVVKPSVRAH